MTEQLPQVSPAPIPTTVAWDHVTFNGPQGPLPFVRLVFQTAAGMGVFHLPAGNARELAMGVLKAAAEIEEAFPATGIIVPNVDTEAVLRSLENGKKPRGRG